MLAVSAGAAVASCAKGGDTTGFHQVGGSTPTTTTEQGGSNAGGSPTTRTITTTDTSTGGSTGTTTTTSSSGGGGSGGGPNCSGTMTCTGAMQIGNVNGDDSSNGDVEHGTTSAWYTLTIVEDSNLPNDLSYNISLANGGNDFELLVYEGDENGVSCTSNPSQGFGSPPTVHHCWGDSYGSPDDRHIIVEVRHVSQTCPGTQWTLSVQGDPDGGSCP